MVSYDDWGNEKPQWTRARVIRLVVGGILLLGAIGGAAYGIYQFAYKKKHEDSGASGSYAPVPIATNNYTFPKALELSLSFLNAQKSGKLPSPFPIEWRGDSCLLDGQDVNLDLTGGLYDAGDHVKFGLPMAFTSTILAWSVLEYAPQFQSAKQLDAAVDIVQWVSDYLVKAHPSKDEFYFQVGHPSIDHVCWQRAEDVNQTARPSFKVDADHPGSDVAGESAAALAAASILFRKAGSYQNTKYADTLLQHARDLFDFATTYPGKYSDSFPDLAEFYNSTGFEDELLWAATWLYEATGESDFMQYVSGTQGTLYAGFGKAPLWLSWDDKRAAVQVLLTRTELLTPQTLHASQLNQYKVTADKLMCALIPNSPSADSRRTKGGLIWVTEWSASVQAVNAAFLSLVYSDYLLAARRTLSCGDYTYNPDQLRHFAFTQVDYLLGNNAKKTSFLVGYGKKFPQFLHHRGASFPIDNKVYSCREGWSTVYTSTSPNPNVAGGGLVGGPAFNETYTDARSNTMQNEASTYNSATLAGLLAGLSYPNKVGVPLTYLS